MIAHSRAHRAMQKYGRLGLGTNLCPQVDEKFAEFEAGKITLNQLRQWLGQVHTDYVSALDQTQEKMVKLRIRLMDAERRLKREKRRNGGRELIREREEEARAE